MQRALAVSVGDYMYIFRASAVTIQSDTARNGGDKLLITPLDRQNESGNIQVLLNEISSRVVADYSRGEKDVNLLTEDMMRDIKEYNVSMDNYYVSIVGGCFGTIDTSTIDFENGVFELTLPSGRTEEIDMYNAARQFRLIRIIQWMKCADPLHVRWMIGALSGTNRENINKIRPFMQSLMNELEEGHIHPGVQLRGKNDFI